MKLFFAIALIVLTLIGMSILASIALIKALNYIEEVMKR